MHRYNGFAYTLAIGMALAAGRANAQTVPAPVTVRFSVEDSTQMLGEPLTLKYVITNTSASDIAINLGREGDEWFALSVATARRSYSPSDSAVVSQSAVYEDVVSVPIVVQLDPPAGAHWKTTV